MLHNDNSQIHCRRSRSFRGRCSVEVDVLQMLCLQFVHFLVSRHFFCVVNRYILRCMSQNWREQYEKIHVCSLCHLPSTNEVSVYRMVESFPSAQSGVR